MPFYGPGGGGGDYTIVGSQVIGGENSLVISTGIENIALGNYSLQFNETGSYNFAGGVYALQQNTTGGQNIGIGSYALNENETGDANIGIGDSSLLHNLNGYFNVGVGNGALLQNIGGNNNVALGASAGRSLVNGDDNIFIGHQADLTGSSTKNNRIVIGVGVESTTDNQIIIGDSTHTSVIIAGASMTGIDYEEGTFTPTLLFGGNNITTAGGMYFYQSGAYRKIGKTVKFTIDVALLAKGTNTGVAEFGGLPYVNSTIADPVSLYLGGMAAGIGGNFLEAFVSASSTSMQISKLTAGVTLPVMDTDFTDFSFFQISGTYNTDI